MGPETKEGRQPLKAGKGNRFPFIASRRNLDFQPSETSDFLPPGLQG